MSYSIRPRVLAVFFRSSKPPKSHHTAAPIRLCFCLHPHAPPPLPLSARPRGPALQKGPPSAWRADRPRVAGAGTSVLRSRGHPSLGPHRRNPRAAKARVGAIASKALSAPPHGTCPGTRRPRRVEIFDIRFGAARPRGSGAALVVFSGKARRPRSGILGSPSASTFAPPQPIHSAPLPNRDLRLGLRRRGTRSFMGLSLF